MNMVIKFRLFVVMFIMTLFFSCSNNNSNELQYNVETKSSTEYRIDSLQDLPYMNYEECREYAIRCAELHNQALEYVFDELRKMEIGIAYDIINEPALRSSLCNDIIKRVLTKLENENSDLYGMMTYFEKASRYTWVFIDYHRDQLFYQHDKYAIILDNIDEMYENKSIRLFPYVDKGISVDIDSLGEYFGSYTPAMPLIFFREVYTQSLKYWQREYYNWFDLLLYIDEVGSGGEEGGEEGEGGKDDTDSDWKEDLKNIGISDADGALEGAVRGIVYIGLGLSVPGANVGVGGTIAATSLAYAIVGSTMTVIEQLSEEVRVYKAEGIYPSH